MSDVTLIVMRRRLLPSFNWTPLFLLWPFASLGADDVSSSIPADLPGFHWHLTARPWQPVNAPRGELVDQMDKAIQATPQKFAELGAEIVRTKNGAIDTSATFLNVVDAFQRTGGAAQNAQLATAILGKGWDRGGGNATRTNKSRSLRRAK